MKISYAITVCNELVEFRYLIERLQSLKRTEDEIVVLFDSVNGTDEVINYLRSIEPGLTYNPIKNFNFRWYSYDFDGNFSNMKNFLNDMCAGDVIFNIDSDEFPHEYLIQHIPDILEENNQLDLLWVPRINTVEGITEEHIKKWGWKINEKGWINFPDKQSRIYRKSPDIRWVNKVHEHITGIKTYASLPYEEEFCLYHPKTITRQEKQNEFYNTL